MHRYIDTYLSLCYLFTVSGLLSDQISNLTQVFRICDKVGRPHPTTLLLNAPGRARGQALFRGLLCSHELYDGDYNPEADNTVRECKNQYVLTFLNLLVTQGRFRTTAFCSLRKSHTHCRIGILETHCCNF